MSPKIYFSCYRFWVLTWLFTRRIFVPDKTKQQHEQPAEPGTMSNQITNADKRNLTVGTQIKCTWTTNMGMGKFETRVEIWTVTGHRNTKNGLRIRLRSQYGYGCVDANFDA